MQMPYSAAGGCCSLRPSACYSFSALVTQVLSDAQAPEVILGDNHYNAKVCLSMHGQLACRFGFLTAEYRGCALYSLLPENRQSIGQHASRQG